MKAIKRNTVGDWQPAKCRTGRCCRVAYLSLNEKQLRALDPLSESNSADLNLDRRTDRHSAAMQKRTSPRDEIGQEQRKILRESIESAVANIRSSSNKTDTTTPILTTPQAGSNSEAAPVAEQLKTGSSPREEPLSEQRPRRQTDWEINQMARRESMELKKKIESAVIGIRAETSSMKMTALHAAVTIGDTVGVQELISLGANVNIENPNKKTPLQLACEAGNLEIAKMLWDVCEESKTQTLLDYASKNQYHSIVQKLAPH